MSQIEDVRALDQLLGAAVPVTVAGIELLIRPFTFGQLPRVLEIVGPFLAGLVQNGQLDLSAIFERDSERALKLCVLATAKPRAWFDAVPSDEGVTLLAAIAEVNADFFTTRLAPTAGDLWSRMKSRFPALNLQSPSPADGPASSSS